MATILILAPRRVFKTVCSSFSNTAKSPTTNASSGIPAKAAQLLTPMVLPDIASTRHLYFSPYRDLIHSVIGITFLPKDLADRFAINRAFLGQLARTEGFSRLGIRRANLLYFVKD